MNPSQKGAFEGIVAANKLVTKAAVFGFDRLVSVHPEMRIFV